MSPAGWWRRKNTAARKRLRARLMAADSGELSWCMYRDGSGGGYIFPCGDWRDRVIESESFSAAQSDPGDRAAEPEDSEAYERYLDEWNDPDLMKQRAADAVAEAECERIWNENRIGLRGCAAQECETTAEVDEPEIE